MHAHPPPKQNSFLSNVASTIQPSSSSPQPHIRQPHRAINLPSAAEPSRRFQHHRKPRARRPLPTLKAQPALVLPADLIEPDIEPTPSPPSSPTPPLHHTQPPRRTPSLHQLPQTHRAGSTGQDPPTTLRFRPGDIVLCRYFNYPVWPATVSRTHQPALRGRYFTMRPTRSGDDAIMAYWVIFSGERVGGWVRTDCLVPYNPMYAHRAQLPSTDPIHHDQKRALSVAADEHSQVGSRFCYTPEDYFMLEELLRIPVNDFVDIKSQDSEADKEPEPSAHHEIPSASTHQPDSSYHSPSSPSQSCSYDSEYVQHPTQRPGLRPRPPRKAHTDRPTLRSDKVSKPRPQRVVLTHSNQTSPVSDNDDDALFISPVKPEPQQIPTSTPVNQPTPPSEPPVQTPLESNPAELLPKSTPAPAPPQKQEPRPFARRKRGRPRKHPLPVATRLAKQETSASTQGQVKREPQDILTHIPEKPSLQSQVRRKRRGRPRKSEKPPPPEPVLDPKETTEQVIDRMQRRINRQEKQIMQMAQQQQQQQNLRAKGSAAGPSTLPHISLLTKLLDPDAIRAQNEKFSQRILAFQKMAAQFAYEAEKLDLARRNCENAWKALVETGRGTEQHLMDLEVLVSKIPEFVDFLRTVRM
ncbi:hypothetical protein BWQ96_01461 [Gracilariopsis chorda]|uniref:PWWP domain-containing protein n=1 Tax=Gracilariopsis chorda TaxID=448386 RepID=A0A2V3J2K4_9FLOR|nr:hypothetical protein BWQ96_01461 [Gracilariopsis chorda]|eukprot:PXF48609.1 hypothetical protein BWQ96_01461 [Gracilariopsis chorda]